jgi:hypothetical protein
VECTDEFLGDLMALEDGTIDEWQCWVAIMAQIGGREFNWLFLSLNNIGY